MMSFDEVCAINKQVEAERKWRERKQPELPEGYFYPGDILAYRAMVESLPVDADIAELGCYKGRSLCSIADIIIAKHLHVEAVDTWHYAPNALEEFNDNLFRFGLINRVIPRRMHSQLAADLFSPDPEDFDEGQKFDLVFIDTPHDYNSVIADLRAWLPLVKPGGIIAGHDYCGKWPGVARALHEMFGDLDFSANVNETDYCVCWQKRVGLNVTPSSFMSNVMYTGVH